MIKTDELRIGNLVYWKPKLFQSNATIEPMEVELTEILENTISYVSPKIELRVEPFEDDMVASEKHYEPLEEIAPIPLSQELLSKLPEDCKYPTWIKYLHELQNWYFWNNNKKELANLTGL